jgi:hypothetical protein
MLRGEMPAVEAAQQRQQRSPPHARVILKEHHMLSTGGGCTISYTPAPRLNWPKRTKFPEPAWLGLLKQPEAVTPKITFLRASADT